MTCQRHNPSQQATDLINKSPVNEPSQLTNQIAK